MFNRIVNWFRFVGKSRSPKHLAARQYWLSCTNTFLAGDPTYYDRQEQSLRILLTQTGAPSGDALDVGCGNGRFSAVLANFAQNTLAFDLSPALIHEARERYGSAENLVFQQRDLEAGLPIGAFRIVGCMGVTSTIIDGAALKELLAALYKATEKGGYLVTKDSLSEKEDQLLTWERYVTMYRNRASYEATLISSGFELIDKVCLAREPEKALVNFLYLWRRLP